jgi:hypothetical protein
MLCLPCRAAVCSRSISISLQKYRLTTTGGTVFRRREPHPLLPYDGSNLPRNSSLA